jgi:hypothetical protein
MIGECSQFANNVKLMSVLIFASSDTWYCELEVRRKSTMTFISFDLLHALQRFASTSLKYLMSVIVSMLALFLF